MDGTLLNANHEVSNRFFAQFERLKEKGILFIAASGRQYESMVSKLDAIKNDIIIIAENGAYAKYRNEVLLTTPLGEKNIPEILNILDIIEGANPVLCSKNSAYVSAKSERFIDMLKEYYTQFKIVEDLQNVKDEILKIAIFHFEDSERFLYPPLQHLENDYKVKVSGANWVDISHKNANKGFALQQVMTSYNITPNEIMVFGDYNNDLEMLKLADYSFAMANAHPNVKAVANYSTTSNTDFGVENILEKLISA